MWFSYCKSSVLAHSTSLQGISTTEDLTITFSASATTSKHQQRLLQHLPTDTNAAQILYSRDLTSTSGKTILSAFVPNTERMVFPSPVFLHTQPLSRGPQPQKRLYNHILYISNYTIASHQQRPLQHLPTDIHAAQLLFPDTQPQPVGSTTMSAFVKHKLLICRSFYEVHQSRGGLIVSTTQYLTIFPVDN